MARPSFIVLWIFITAFVVCPLYAQNTGLLSQPIIHGEVNGMKVMAQGDAVAFMASRYYSMELDGKACARDLHCTMQKNRTEVVVLNPEGILIIDSPSKELPSNVTITESLYPVFTEVIRLSSTAIEPTPTHVPLEFPQPTATLHTGNDAVDKTPGILLVSSPLMTWLAETTTTVSHSRQAMDSGESLTPIIEPTPTQQKTMLTTITEEEDELLRKLTSTSAMPMPTLTPTLLENRLWVDGVVRLEIETDILTIKPSSSGQYGTSTSASGSFTFTVKQVPTEAGTKAEKTTSNEGKTSSSEMQVGATSVAPLESPVITVENKQASEEDIKALLADMDNLDLPDLPAELMASQDSKVREKPEAAAQAPMTREELQERLTLAIKSGNAGLMASAAEDILRSWESTIDLGAERTHLLKPDLVPDKPASELTYEEMRKMIERMGDDSHDLVMTNREDLLVEMEISKEAGCIGLLQDRFEEDAWELVNLSSWRTVPEYTADEKRRLLAKDKIDGYGAIETLEETAKRIAKLNKMTDAEIHKKYNDLEIHHAMKVDAGLVRFPHLTYSLGRFLLHDYSAQEKRAIIFEYHKHFPDGTDELVFKAKWRKASDLDVHRAYSDEIIRKMKEAYTQTQQ